MPPWPGAGRKGHFNTILILPVREITETCHQEPTLVEPKQSLPSTKFPRERVFVLMLLDLMCHSPQSKT